MKQFKVDNRLPQSKDLKSALVWWSQFNAKNQTLLQKEHGVFSYWDLVQFWKAEGSPK